MKEEKLSLWHRVRPLLMQPSTAHQWLRQLQRNDQKTSFVQPVDHTGRQIADPAHYNKIFTQIQA